MSHETHEPLNPPQPPQPHSRPAPLRSHLAIAALASALALSSTACRSAPDPVPWASTFPSGLRQEQVLDIQVVRDSTRISLTNTTASDLEPGSLWINRRFSLPFQGLKVGDSITLSLSDFRDEYSEPFRAGGFFASDAPDSVVQAQLVSKDPAGKSTLRGLIVVNSN